MRFKIEIKEGSQQVDCAGHPLELLMELTTFFVKQEECRHLLKYAIQLSETAETHVKENGKIDIDSPEHSGATAIIDEFMKRYDKAFSEKEIK